MRTSAIALLVVAACSSRSEREPAATGEPATAATVPAAPTELELPDMGVAIRVPAGWKPDLTRDPSRPNDKRQSQIVSSAKELISIYRVGKAIHTMTDARAVIASRMLSTKMGTVHRARELPQGTLLLAYDAIMPSGTTYPEVRVVIPGDEPIVCLGSGATGHDFALLERICSSLRTL